MFSFFSVNIAVDLLVVNVELAVTSSTVVGLACCFWVLGTAIKTAWVDVTFEQLHSILALDTSLPVMSGLLPAFPPMSGLYGEHSNNQNQREKQLHL